MSRWSVFRQGTSLATAAGIIWAVVTALVGAVSVPTTAAAQNFWDSVFQQQRANRRPPTALRRPPPPRSATRRPAAPAAAAAVTAASTATAATATLASTAKPGGTAADADDSLERPLMAVISLEDQRLTLYGVDGVLATSRISSGRSSHATPTGIFGVLQKNRWHESNIYSGASMPYMQRLTWSGIALHEGVLPGYPASHGCIRLPRAFAARLFEITRPGFRVVVGPDDLAPRAIVHSGLPQPRYEPVPLVPSSRLETASLSLVTADASAAAVPAGPGLDPIAYARAERNRARSELRASEIAAKAAAKAARAAETWQAAEAEKLELAERRMASAMGLLDDLGLLGVPPVEHELTRTLPIAVADYMAAEGDIEPARRREAEARSELQTARSSREVADRSVAELKARVAEMTRRLETVSIMISRKDGKVYVRQALRTVLEAPVTIRDAEDPIGHHVYVAWPPKAGETTLQWKALSMPAEEIPVRRAKVTKEPTKDGATSLPQAVRIETAATALDRIVLPDEVRAEVERLVFTGASLMITDRGRGHDGAVGHDFAIETRH